MKDRFAGAFDHRIADQRHRGKRIGTLWADYTDVDGDATLTADFLDQSPLTRADILQDIIGVLQREYELAVSHITTDRE